MYETDVQSHPEPTPPVRPRQVKVAAFLLGGLGVLGLLVSLLLIESVSDSHGASVPAVLYVLAYGQLLLCLTQVVCGIFVWQGRAWARGVAIGLCSLNLLGAVVLLLTGTVVQAITAFAINAGLIRVLSDDEVKAWCDN